MRIFTLFLLLTAMVPIALSANLPTCYYTYDQITNMLFDYEQQHPDIAKVHLIGYTQQDNLPIYAMQITDNVDIEEEEPALLFVGQVHAEEVLGVQITMYNIQQILQRRNQHPYSMWIDTLDTWFVPTLNPEGHNVVTSNLDTSYRKNKRDNNENGIFDFNPQVGRDIDGVDINRNFDFNWVHGDTLYQPPTPTSPEHFDYYRGPSPNSESEVAAIRQLADWKKFVYSICWHSSRSGYYAERVYYSFNWKQVRPSPDLAFAQAIAGGVAATITKENGSGPYEHYPNESRRGAFHDYLYQQHGTIQLLIEVGTSNLQPDSLLMVNTIQRATNGVWWLMNRSLLFSTAVPSSSMLTGHTTDSSTQQPIEAEIIIQERHAPWFRPRTSNPDTGRYFKPLPPGSYTVQARKKGYWDKIQYNTQVYNSNWSFAELALDPKSPAVMYGNVHSGGQPIPARIIIHDIQPDTLFINGEYVFHGYEGEYQVEITAEGYYPYLGTVNLAPGQNLRVFNLSPANPIFSENWESGTSQWEINGPWVLQDELAVSGNAITDSYGGRGTYAVNCNVWIKTANPINIPGGNNPLLVFDSHAYTEWDYDPVRVEASADGETWDILWQKSGRLDTWRNEYIPLDTYAGNSIYLRFRLEDQSTAPELADPGWTIDNIRIITGTATDTDDNVAGIAPNPALYPNFPNPFNPETTLRFSLPKAETVSLEIFNLKGQKVRSYSNMQLSSGDHSIVWNATDDKGNSLPSGIYMYRLNAGNYSRSRKMILMK
jgi:hypothetical protein